MKFLISLFMLVSFSAFAEPVIIEIGGVRHQCTPVGSGNAATCFNSAYGGSFSKDQALRLCAGAYSDAPANCGNQAYRGRWSREESINLCIGSTSNSGPVDCANLAYSGPFSSSESMDLCSRNGSERTATCALEAYRGPFSKEEAISMCKNPRFAEEKSLRSDKEYSKIEMRALIEETNVKAFEKKEYK
jgi:hypothetical protein